MCKLYTKTQFVSDLRLSNSAGLEVQDAFFVRKVAREGGEKVRYEVSLADRSGNMLGKIWQEAMRDTHEQLEGSLAMVKGFVNIYRGVPEISISSMEPFDTENFKYQVSDYCTSCVDNLEVFYNAFIEQYHKDIRKPHLLKLLDTCYKQEACAKRFRELQGSKAIHHVEMGGYMLHVTTVYRICKAIAAMYELHPDFDMEVLLTAAALHDIGKVKEYKPLPYNEKTDAGYLIGHLGLSLIMASKIISDIPDFPKEDENKLLHCIITPHGDHDRIVKPATIEAQILHRADEMDARIDSFNTLIANDTRTGNMTKYSKLYDQFIYKK